MATVDPDILSTESSARTGRGADGSVLSTQLGYSCANMGKSVVWTSFESIMLFYLVSIAGFGPLAAGALLAVTLLWDAAFDLAVARWTDARGGSQGLARLVLFGAPLCGMGFWLIFVLQAPMAVAAAIVACRIGYSLCDVGHNTLLIRVAQRPGDAARVSGLRLLFSASGVALLALASGTSLSLADPQAQRQSLATAAMGGGALYMGTLFVALWATRHLTPPPRAAGRIGAPKPLRDYARNPDFSRLLLVIAVQAAFVPLFQR
ncbi:MFS transporter, partial [Sphingomonas sanguinis]|uniref:MFS transporter n=1 Tax=Sphingomonas sanguinis TaxID=33051 RepID=UPI000AFF8391